MKKLVILLISLFLAVNLVSALDCQYTDTEDYQELEPKLVTNQGEIFGNPLVILGRAFERNLWALAQ